MPSINKAIIMGHVGRACNVKVFQTGTVMASFSVATTKKIKNEYVTEWHEVVCWGKTAEYCGDINKGDLVYIDGEIKTDKFTDKTGNEREVKKINALTVKMIKKSDKKEEQKEAVVDEKMQDIKNFLGADYAPECPF